MTDHHRFSQLLAEFRRVGVDPDTFSAVISISPDEALEVLSGLEDDAGPAAFLAQFRHARRRDDADASRHPPAQPPA